MSLNPFAGLGRSIAGGWVARAFGLGSQHPVIRGIIAIGMTVALTLFVVREFYDVQTARNQAVTTGVEAHAKSFTMYDHRQGKVEGVGPGVRALLRTMESTGAVDGGACNPEIEPIEHADVKPGEKIDRSPGKPLPPCVL